MPHDQTRPLPLAGIRILSLAPNLPGPAALRQLAAMGASCLKFDPPSGDPMALYAPAFHGWLHEGIEVRSVDLKSTEGQQQLHAALNASDLLITSSRPSALARLGLTAERLTAECPHLGWVEIVGDHAPHDDHPGHDLTYQAEAGLVCDQLPVTLLADMGGALMATQAALELLVSRFRADASARLRLRRVALAEAARYLALPLQWGLTAPGALLGGAHPGYQVLRCADGWVALAALEPHFQTKLRQVIATGVPDLAREPDLRTAAATWCLSLEATALNQSARDHDLPLLAWHRPPGSSVKP